MVGTDVEEERAAGDDADDDFIYGQFAATCITWVAHNILSIGGSH